MLINKTEKFPKTLENKYHNLDRIKSTTVYYNTKTRLSPIVIMSQDSFGSQAMSQKAYFG